MNPSIVDYLKSQGQASDYATRANLAAARGITNYTGSAQQNTQLLAALRGQSSGGQVLGASTTNSGSVPPGQSVQDRYGVNAQFIDTPDTVTRGPNESSAAYAQRLAASPFNLAGGRSSTVDAKIYMTPDQVQQSYLANLTANTPQTQQLTTPNVSPGQPGVGGIDGMIAYYKSLFDTNKQQQTDLQTQIASQRATEGKQITPYLQNLQNADSRAQVEQKAWQQTGINAQQYFAQEKAQISEIQAATEKFNSAVAQRDAQIAQTQDKLGSMNFISNQTAQINRNAAPVLNQMSADINSKAAVLQASQGMFAEAQKYVNQAVDAATADLKYNFDMYTTLYNQNEDIIKGLDSKLQNAYTQQTQIAEKAFTYAQDQKTKVGQLMLDNPQAGISIGSDSLQTAMEKVQKSPKTTGTTVGSADTGYQNIVRDSQGNVIKTQSITGAKATGAVSSTQANDGAVRAGMDVNSFKALPSDIQVFFSQTSDANVTPIKENLISVSTGDMTPDEFNTWLNQQSYSSTVKNFLKSQATEAAKTAPPKKPSIGSKIWSGLKSMIGLNI